jgi:hypothetical protein
MRVCVDRRREAREGSTDWEELEVEDQKKGPIILWD